MRRFYVIAPRRDGGAGPQEISEADARERHTAGEEVLFAEDDGPMAPVPAAAAEEQASEPVGDVPAVPKRRAKG